MRTRLTTDVALESVWFEIFQCQSSLIVLVLGDLFQEVSHVQQIGFMSGDHSRKESFPLIRLSEDGEIGPVSQLFPEPEPIAPLPSLANV